MSRDSVLLARASRGQGAPLHADATAGLRAKVRQNVSNVVILAENRYLFGVFKNIFAFTRFDVLFVYPISLYFLTLALLAHLPLCRLFGSSFLRGPCVSETTCFLSDPVAFLEAFYVDPATALASSSSVSGASTAAPSTVTLSSVESSSSPSSSSSSIDDTAIQSREGGDGCHTRQLLASLIALSTSATSSVSSSSAVTGAVDVYIWSRASFLSLSFLLFLFVVFSFHHVF